MKGLFLMFYGFNAFNGISKKIAYQVDALHDNGIEMRICHYETSVVDGTRTWMIDDKVLHCFGNSLIGKLRKRIDYHFIVDYIRKEKFDFIYWRSFHNANPFTIWFIRSIHKMDIPVILEIPTFPYDHEYASLKAQLSLLPHRLFRGIFCKYVNRIVTFSNDQSIFGVPTICISNGIDFSQIPLRSKLHNTNNELHLVAVAEIHFWHGYDRLIEGLHMYYQNNPKYKVYFHLAGLLSGKREKNEVADAITRYHLEDYVHLYGPLHGEALEELFNKGDFAIGSLGRHRSGITHIKTLKNREYAARGFAFTYAECDDDFDTMPYVLRQPADESPIDIQGIIDFCQKQKFSPQAIRDSIRHLSWNEQMKKVVDYLQQQ